MQHFLALAWNTRADDQDAAARTLIERLSAGKRCWTNAWTSPGLQVFHSGKTHGANQTYPLGQNGGLVFGRLFAHGRAPDLRCGDADRFEQEVARIRRSGGQHLIENFWGRYVAFIRDESGQTIHVLRDPSGAIPCFTARFGDVHVMCSRFADCASLGLVGEGIDWNHLAAYLCFDSLVTSHTALQGVRLLLAGECVSIGPDGVDTRFRWQPDRICEQRVIEDRRGAARELRKVLEGCVRAWASVYGCILHQLSGGLDSAVVLGCLSRRSPPPNVLCENRFTQSPQADERRFARLAAEAARVELVETRIRTTPRPLEEMFGTEKYATPAHMAFIPESVPQRRQLIRKRGIDAVFTGQGGDHLFQRFRTPLIAAEFMQCKGIGRGFSRVLMDTAVLTGKPIWSIISAAIRSGLLRRHVDPYSSRFPPPLLDDAAFDAIYPGLIRHPWVDLAIDLPDCKRRQVFDIVDTQNFLWSPDLQADIVHPIVSQPVIELCLQIPSYILAYGGRERALVRDAFAGRIPAEIASRTTKGSTTGSFARLLANHLPAIRALLLDGRLAGERLLDKSKIDAALKETSLLQRPELFRPLLSAVRAELWLDQWRSGERNPVA